MILIDQRIGSKELLPLTTRLGVKSELGDLEFGDVAFEGHGPKGTISVGIERKTLHDLLNCIDDSRLSGHQLIGLKQMYDVRVLMVEGHWKPHDPQGLMMEGFNNGCSWGYVSHRSQRTMYAKAYRYLISVSLSGVIVTHTRDLFHSAFNICEWFHYFQKPWGGHTSLQELQKINIPTLQSKPSLTRKWATDLEGIGVKLGAEAEKVFKRPITLANADELEWLRVPGVGVKTAQSIVKEIWGNK